MLKELHENDFIISKTDTKGKLTYVNQSFLKMSEYTEDELLGKPHSIIRHNYMPKAIFKLLWQTIQNKEELFAFVINITKQNNAYWVFANVTASLDTNNNIIGYYSVRRKANPDALRIISDIYKKMIDLEKQQGVEASSQYLNTLLNEQGMSYEQYIISLQK